MNKKQKTVNVDAGIGSMLKSASMVQALNRLAERKPRGCIVGLKNTQENRERLPLIL